MLCLERTAITSVLVSNSKNNPVTTDYLLWLSGDGYLTTENLGEAIQLSPDFRSTRQQLLNWAKNSHAEYGLLWSLDFPLPDETHLHDLIQQGIDLAHTGLHLGMGALMPDLCLALQDWSMINAASDSHSSSWRASLQACLVRRQLLLDLDGLDPAFASIQAAGLDFGLRAMRQGALVEYRPELLSSGKFQSPEPPPQDLYVFILRHFGQRWAQYVFLRRALARPWNSLVEHSTLHQALAACQLSPRPAAKPVWYSAKAPRQASFDAGVSVIIPTLGRYEYLRGALDSLRQQTLRPNQIIVIDQNPPEQRHPKIYQGYEDLNLQVIWQDQRGQSLARNTGLATARGPYVFLFDDDSLALPDLIAAHLDGLQDGRWDVSTGVAYPPPPSDYQLPPNFGFPRLAQTLDTGNCMLLLSLARSMGGLDRNYDFGPGTDADFGTRLYLDGYRILHNPRAGRIHFKAPTGGLRVYGVKKYYTDAGLLQPFPPVTRSYYALRFLTPRQRREVNLINFVASKFPQHMRRGGGTLFEKVRALALFWTAFFLLPLKQHFSLRRAQKLLYAGPQLAKFTEPEISSASPC